MKSRWKIFLCLVLGLYVALMLMTWRALTNRAWHQTESMLDYAMLDLDSTLNGSFDTMLMHAAETIVRELGEPAAHPIERMAAIARQRDVDEVNLIARDGTILASTDPRLPGLSMTKQEETRAFMVLTNGVRHALSQPFRAGANMPEVRRKYVGVAFPKGNGYVQVGLDETRSTRMFPSIMGFIFDEWLLGQKGFFLCADIHDGHLISNPARHRDEAANLAETGYDPEDPAVREDGRTTFRQRLFGDMCDCRAVIFCGHRVIAALPPAEFYTTRDFYATLMAVIIAGILSLFIVLFRRIDGDSERLKAFYAAEEANRARELSLGSTIQKAVLPVDFPHDSHFRLAAAMHAARNVGGDFYDFFHLDNARHCFLVADVSGKGITAALYMMTAKTLIRNMLLSERDPAAALTRANRELCRNNPANMFLTAWVGVLDIESGVVTFANAGHNPPVVRRADGSISFIRDRSGCMLSFIDTIEYKPRKITLGPGDNLFLYTDGVTEAMDVMGELFGDDRLARTLEAAPSSDPESICRLVRASVAAFADGVPQADDITVLSVLFVSPVKRSVHSFPPKIEAIEEATAFLDAKLEEAGCPPATQASLDIVLDEIASNIVKFSGASGFTVEIELTDDPKGVTLVFGDDGLPYNPLEHADPDTTLSAAERQIGGLGILMVKKIADKIRYTRVRNRNFLVVQKNFPA